VQSKHPKTNSVFKRAPEPALRDRTFIEGYLRGKQLGRGGFSKVWEGFNFKTKTFYAVKEIDTTNKYQTHLTEIWFGNFFFESGEPRKQFADHEGIHSLIRMFTYSIMDPRAFIVYENCNGSLGNMLYDIYEEDRDDDVDEDDKLYMIKYKPLYSELRKSTSFLRTMMYQIAQALDLLSKHRIVHPKYAFKLIDYGSSFVFDNLKQYKLATPEYMCPELLNYILH
jgi:dual specificity tyrosine-phosphorylation-regulated kinase 2/3/4